MLKTGILHRNKRAVSEHLTALPSHVPKQYLRGANGAQHNHSNGANEECHVSTAKAEGVVFLRLVRLAGIIAKWSHAGLERKSALLSLSSQLKPRSNKSTGIKNSLQHIALLSDDIIYATCKISVVLMWLLLLPLFYLLIFFNEALMKIKLLSSWTLVLLWFV